jgi:hypothetical protein
MLIQTNFKSRIDQRNTHTHISGYQNKKENVTFRRICWLNEANNFIVDMKHSSYSTFIFD